MIKGVRWSFVVLFLAASVWVTSSLNAKHRPKRQLQQNAFFPPLSRDGLYLPPIPVRFPPHSGSVGRSAEGRGQSPWVPLQSEEMDNRNVYVPPIRPPVMTVTHKPPKTTFDIPLTKSIRVGHSRPGLQTTGYLRKSVVKVHATRTTTQHPRQKMLESTVQTLVEEGWRPRSVSSTVPQTTATPNFHFGKNLGSKVDKHLNYTGVRFGKVNTVLRTMPRNGTAVKLSKNETNFVMKFTPEDVKFTSVEVKTEKIDSPFSVDSPEIKHLAGGSDERRSFFDRFSDPHKTATDLRNEGNLPYQGHKTTMENTKMKNYVEPHKTIFDIFPGTPQKFKDPRKEMRFPGEELSADVPFSSEKTNFPLRVGNKVSDPKEKNKPSDSQNTKKEVFNVQVSDINRNVFLQPSNAYGVGVDQQSKSNLPYQGQVGKPQVSINSDYGSPNSRKPQVIIQSKHRNDQKIPPAVPFTSSPQYVPTHNPANAPFSNNKDSTTPTTSSHSDIHEDDSVSNSDKLLLTNKTAERGCFSAVNFPSTAGVQHEKNSSPTAAMTEGKRDDDSDSVKENFRPLNSHIYAQNFPSVVSITHEDVSNAYENKNNEDQLPSKPAFEEEPKLKEVELKNPPKYLQFHDEDFLRPVIPLHYDADQSFASGGRTEDESSDDLETSKTPKSSQISASKVEYYVNSKSEEKRPSEDSTYFQPMFPDTKTKDISQQRFQNYNTDQSSLQSSDGTKKDPIRSSLPTDFKDRSKSREKAGQKYLSTLQKISKDVIVTKDTYFGPEDAKQNGHPRDIPRVITLPTVITMNYNTVDDPSERGGQVGRNRTENYVIQRKPALLPETAGRPRKPKITISTGMLAGILIAALVFLGFLTGSVVYAFHQWKFGRGDKKKKKKGTSRSPGFPPEYLDENFAGNTYIHNNIFLPTPQSVDERDPDSASLTGDDLQPSTSSRGGRRHRTFREVKND